MTVLVERSAYVKPTAIMSVRWNIHQVERPGAVMSFTILTTIAEMESIAKLTLPPLVKRLE